jgi:hypothetical protein
LFKLIRQYKSKPNGIDNLLTFKDFHNIRFSFIHNIFDFYKLLINNDSFDQHLKGLKSWYVWNIYKQLSSEVLDKVAALKYSDIESNFKSQIMEKLKQHIVSKIHLEKDSLNDVFDREVHFQIVVDNN